jgi:hypothetical protein
LEERGRALRHDYAFLPLNPATLEYYSKPCLYGPKDNPTSRESAPARLRCSEVATSKPLPSTRLSLSMNPPPLFPDSRPPQVKAQTPLREAFPAKFVLQVLQPAVLQSFTDTLRVLQLFYRTLLRAVLQPVKLLYLVLQGFTGEKDGGFTVCKTGGVARGAADQVP